MTQLAIPVRQGNRLFTHVQIGGPTAQVIADTHREITRSNMYSGMIVFISGAVEAYVDESGQEESSPAQVKQITRGLTFATAEQLALEALLQTTDDDGIEGYYECPRCGEAQVAERRDDEDTRDHVSDLETHFMEEGEPVIQIELDEPVTARDKKSGEVVVSISEFTMAFPTLGICALAYNKYGASDGISRQFAFYTDSLLTANGAEITQKWRAQWGMYLFGHLPTGPRSPLRTITNRLREYGVDAEVAKTCRKCGKVWEQTVDTSNFFASGLQSL